MKNAIPSLASLLLLACAQPTVTTAHDSTGAELELSCSGTCEVTRGPSLADFPCAGVAGWGSMWGRFYSVCAFCDASTTNGRCRPLACEEDADCPVVQGDELDAYECVEGLCENADQSRFPRDVLTPFDARMLCYADVPRADTVLVTSPASIARESALASECSIDAASCSLPAACTAP